MGLIARQAGAPIADGETCSGTEVEAEFSTMHTVINGNIEDVNLSTGGDLDGSKFAMNTFASAKVPTNALTGAKFASTITTEQMITRTVTQVFIDTDTGTETTTTSASYVDVPGVTAWTVTPGSLNFILMECIVYIDAGTAGTLLTFSFSVDGTPQTAQAAAFSIVNGTPTGLYFSHMMLAPDNSSMIIKPVYLRPSGSSTTSFSVAHVANSKVFRGMIIPSK